MRVFSLLMESVGSLERNPAWREGRVREAQASSDLLPLKLRIVDPHLVVELFGSGFLRHQCQVGILEEGIFNSHSPWHICISKCNLHVYNHALSNANIATFNVASSHSNFKLLCTLKFSHSPAPILKIATSPLRRTPPSIVHTPTYSTYPQSCIPLQNTIHASPRIYYSVPSHTSSGATFHPPRSSHQSSAKPHITERWVIRS